MRITEERDMIIVEDVFFYSRKKRKEKKEIYGEPRKT